ncbi:MAG: DUF2130 domain-containing protein [Bacteroidetes bacterium]|nr:DUF2130 domain-containing protein [Bacteroidota bacterium]
MTGLIICPNCKHQFEPTNAFREEVQRELNNKAKEWQAKKEEEFLKKEKDFQLAIQNKDAEFAKRLQDEKTSLQKTLEENLRKNISADYENQLRLLQQSNKDNEEKLKLSRQKELEFLQKEQELKNREAELEISVQRKLLDEREKLKIELSKEEAARIELKEQEFQMRLKEMEKQLDDQKRLTEEMKRRQEQGSMQLQGEVQELILEELLKSNFPFDDVSEVGKGVKGADCIQTVRNNFGQECGKIIYESKRTKDFSGDWIEKLKADMRSQGADVAVIVTQTMPKEMNHFGEKNGVWICSFTEVRALVHVLRDGILKIYNATKSQENRGDKMHLLYDYLTSNEFGEQWKAIREGFTSMKQSIQRERDAMEKLWKAREKQLEKVLLNAAHIRGSIEGIAGQDSIDMNLLDNAEGLNLE